MTASTTAAASDGRRGLQQLQQHHHHPHSHIRRPQILAFGDDQEALVKEPEPETPPPFPLDHVLESFPASPMSATSTLSPSSSGSNAEAGSVAGVVEGEHDANKQADVLSTSPSEWDAAREQAWESVHKRAGRRRRAIGNKIDQARRTPRHRDEIESSYYTGRQDAQQQPDRGMSLLDSETTDDDDEGLEEINSRSLHDVEEDDLDEADASRQRGPREGQASPSGLTEVETPSNEVMFQAFIDEFGELQQSHDHKEEEKWIGAITAILINSVTIRGSLLMTSHRLAFVAMVPAGGTQPKGSGSRTGKPDAHPQNRIIRKGPAILHFPGWRRHRTAWFELRDDSLVCYRNSTSLYTPVGSARLSDMTLKPLEWSRSGKVKNNSTKIHLHGPTGIYTLEFFSHETAVSWYKDFEAAMWSYSKAQERVRLLVPLERLKVFRVDLEKRVHISLQLEVLMNTPKHHDGHYGRSETQSFELGCFSRDICSINELEDAYESAQKRTRADIYDPSSIPAPITEIEGSREKAEALNEAASHADSDGLSARLVKLFTLNDAPDDLKIVKADIIKGYPLSGTLAVGAEYLVFYRHRLPPFHDVRVKVPLSDLVGVEKGSSLKFHYHGIKILIRGNPSLHFELKSTKLRDLVMKALEGICEQRTEQESTLAAPVGQPSHTSTMYADPLEVLLAPVKAQKTTVLPYETIKQLPRLINPAADYRLSVEPMRVICLTIGSRGDVQPYIALAVALKAHGHSPVIVSHPEYREWVEKYGIEFRGAGGDPGALMKLSVEHRLFSPAFFRESLGKFRAWLDELLRESFEGCWDADLIIESPSTMAGIHVAEALQCYYFRAFTMPWTRTAAFPQAFSVPPVDLGEAYNLSSYTLFDRVFWQATSGQINRWRRHMLGLAPINFAELDQDSVPFVYNFSPAVVPHPVDWADRIAVSGYWNLDSSAEQWDPPQELTNFMEKARKEDKKIAYIGFGSITVPDPHKVTSNIYDAVVKADVRAIVAKGWSSRAGDRESTGEQGEPEVPAEVYVVDSIPHDWLFPKIDLALHHGGAGSTGASLRAGLVTLIHPFFGDQFFWAGRVQKLGAGLRIGDLDVDNIAEGLKKASQDRIMREKATSVGELIQSEDGVGNAIAFIESHLALSERKYHPLKKKRDSSSSGGVASHDEDEEENDEEDKENDECIQRDSSILRRALALALPGKKNGAAQEGLSSSSSSPSSSASSSKQPTPSRSFLSLQGNHLPSFNGSFTSSLKDLVPGLHGNGHDSSQEAQLASIKEVADEKQVEGDDASPKKGVKEDEEELRRAKKEERRSAKCEDERRRKLMEPKLQERRRLLEQKKRDQDESADLPRRRRSEHQEQQLRDEVKQGV
ncbi:UDP-Glycosyltransferase/glycogen phosphorylase [Jaminaea rosea]|uniref:sterol 3beta-glucosyltransferase n=1 Tax=Jaminaea rosea TaxID=1569628 RepID=A0A316UY11_9BASI|nr:UDP-Glycosyltransferase/glycogen phosphorylase [Jaminaea rosea]PWN30102.1 UDP-Glycosyltransferase/glycogen phosphorylase [Jaminaea rosea]